MFRVLLIDEDKIILDSMSKIINWESYNCCVCAVAYSFKDGLNKIKELRPDIIVANMTMNKMRGLEVLEKASSYIRDAEVIAISDYMDFGYVQTACALGVRGFVQRSLQTEEFKRVLEAATTRLESEKKKFEETVCLKKELGRTRKFVNEKIFKEMLDDSISNWDRLSKDFESIADIERYIVFTLNISGNQLISNTRMSYQSKEIFEQVFCEGCTALAIHQTLTGELTVILVMQRPFPASKLLQMFEELQSRFEKVQQAKVFIGISGFGHGISQVKEKYLESKQALDYKIDSEKSAITFYDSVSDDLPPLTEGDTVQYILLLDAVFTGNSEIVRKMLANTRQEFKSNVSLKSVKEFAVAVIFRIYEIYNTLNGKQKNDYNHKTIAKFVGDCKNVDECMAFLEEMCEGMSVKIRRLCSNRFTFKMEKAMEYIDARYQQTVTRDELATHLGISSNYLSAMFKKELNMTLMEYLTEVRIEKAKKLLRTTDDKINEIAGKSGFSDAYYFSKTFKYKSGFTPSQYRNMHE